MNSLSMGASFYRLLSSEFDLGAIFGNAIGATFNTAFGRDCKGRPQGDYFFGCQVQNWVIWNNFILVVKVCWPVQHRKEEEVSPGHAVLHKQQPGSSNSSFLKTLQLSFPFFFQIGNVLVVPPFHFQGVGGDFARCTVGSLLNRRG